MKRSLIASILGIAVSVARSYGDNGQVVFSNYLSSFYYHPVCWGDTANGHTAGQPINETDNFHAVLFYGNGPGLSFDQLTAVPSSKVLVGLFGFVSPAGAILNRNVLLPNWTPGTQTTFGIEVYNGANYASSTYRSLNNITWTEASTTVTPYGGTSGPNGFTEIPFENAYQNGFLVYPAPEPEMLAFAGLGTAALWVFRRKNLGRTC